MFLISGAYDHDLYDLYVSILQRCKLCPGLFSFGFCLYYLYQNLSYPSLLHHLLSY